MKFFSGGEVEISDDDRRESVLSLLARVAAGTRNTALDECLEIVLRAKDDFKASIEAVIALRDVERLICLLKKGRAT